MTDKRTEWDPLRVLITDHDPRRIELVEAIEELGHTVIMRNTEPDLSDIAQITKNERPDVAVVLINGDSVRALKMIDKIVHESLCPVIAFFTDDNDEFVQEAAKHGIFAYIGPEANIGGQIQVVLQRFTEYHNLEAAFYRRATIEQAKGILMERNGVDSVEAFNMIRDHARRANRRVIDIATSTIEAHDLLPSVPSAPPRKKKEE